MPSKLLVKKAFNRVSVSSLTQVYGKVTQVHGYFIEASYTDAKVGEVAKLFAHEQELECEVVSISDEFALLAPLEMPLGVSVGSRVKYTGSFPEIPFLREPFGKILNGLGQDITFGRSHAVTHENISLFTNIPSINTRAPVDTIANTSIKVIDHLLPIGRGQKLGIFSGSGVGKSTLLNKIQKNVQADIKIVAMIGERSREVVEFYEEYLAQVYCKDTFIVASTSDESPMMKHRALSVALSYAQAFRDEGKHVLLVVDSITRFAHALREIGISRGELPIARGYPTSVFTGLSKVVETCGNFKNGGCITGIMSILVDGDDENEPISDYMRGILDGHLLLDRRLSDRGLYPSVDILKSRSRVTERILSSSDIAILKDIMLVYSKYSDIEDVVKTGIHVPGSNSDIDDLIRLKELLDVELYSSGESLNKEMIHEISKYKTNSRTKKSTKSESDLS
ncbi:Flagellum-specific ATP synthase [Vibrio chagasii]|uniref:FliI/YscN family ATPase n=1 Tax=Vibrio chagasii TaxID=170679 RepID=UPI00337736F4|nr:Flagellum-specific ATP synthase [Vibrio chagasii]